MAITRTLAQLAGDLRLGDGSTAPTGAVASVLGRIDATARAMVLRYAPGAPDAIHNEAYVRLASWLYDADPTGRGGRAFGDPKLRSGSDSRAVPGTAGGADRRHPSHLMSFLDRPAVLRVLGPVERNEHEEVLPRTYSDSVVWTAQSDGGSTEILAEGGTRVVALRLFVMRWRGDVEAADPRDLSIWYRIAGEWTRWEIESVSLHGRRDRYLQLTGQRSDILDTDTPPTVG